MTAREIKRTGSAVVTDSSSQSVVAFGGPGGGA